MSNNTQIKKISAFIFMMIIFVVFIYNVNKEATKEKVDIDKNFINNKEFTREWTYEFDSDIYSAALGNNGKLYCTTLESTLYEVDLRAKQVKKLIKYSDNLSQARPLLNSKNQIVLELGMYIKVFDLESNKIVSEGKTKKALEIATVNDNKIFYSESGTINIQARDLNTINLAWEYVPHIQHVSTSLIADGKKLYAYGGNGNLLVLDTDTGEILDEFDANSRKLHIIEDDYLYMGYLRKINRHTGEKIWSVDTNMVSDVNIDSKHLYYFDKIKEELVCLDKTNGFKKWNTFFGDVSLYYIVTTEKYVVTKRDDGTVFIIDKTNGEKLWRYDRVEADIAQPMFTYKEEAFIFSENILESFDLSE